MLYWLQYIAVGGCAGIMAGLLGVGGGIIIVPMLILLFTAQGLPAEYIAHLALGTSMASIVFTSVSSFRAHHYRGAVDWEVVFRISPGIIAGTLAGSWVAAQLSTRFLKGFFVVFLYYIALQLLKDIRPKPARSLPAKAGMFGVGSVIGIVSSLVGIGGGSMSVPFLIWCNLSVIRAIGTSAAIGFPIAVSGAAGYIINGYHSPGLPAGSIGFVYLPALAAVAATSFLAAPLGAKIAHALPVAMLKKIFAVLVIVLGTRMLLGLWQ